MTNDLAPSRQKLAAIGRSAKGRVTGRLKTALDLVVNDRLDPYEAAAKVGMHARSMRMALNRRNVLTYLRHTREVLRTSASAQNIHYAMKMRAESPNEMARLGAMKLIEQMDDDRAPGRGVMNSPGLVLVIERGPVQPIEKPAKPVIEHEPASPRVFKLDEG